MHRWYLPIRSRNTYNNGKIINATTTVDGKPVNSKNETIVQLVKEYNVDMVVVGPEQPLVDGLVDCLKMECGEGLRVFGPSKDAAELEASKVCVCVICVLY